MRTSHIIGNESVKTLLADVLASGKPSHAYLFHGPAGAGKTAMAISFARCLMGIDDGEHRWDDAGTPGGFKHPDFALVTPDGNFIKIDQVRELVRATAMKPVLAKRKVFVIDDAGCMNEEASNSILKVLEEPPSFMAIILVTSQLGRIFPTILSRCSPVPFGPVPKEQIVQYLVRERGVDRARAEFLAQLSGGNVSKALQATDDAEGHARRERLFAGLSNVANGRVTDILVFAKEHGARKEGALELTREIATWARDMSLYSAFGDAARDLVLNIDKEQAIKSDCERMGPAKIEALLNGLGKLYDNYARTKGNLSFGLALEATLLAALAVD